jgi:predicted MFS family arabinose efflux permease
MTSDSARVVGALTGAGLIATLGMGPAYLVITAFYAGSLLLTLCVKNVRRADVASPAATRAAPRASPWRDLVEAFGYVRRTPVLLAAMWLAFLVNLTAYPLTLGLLPYVAKDIYLTDQTGLGYLVASFAFGALIGSLGLTHWGGSIRAGRCMVVFACFWYLLLAVFAQMPTLALAMLALLFAGCAQSLSLVPMSTILLRHSDERYRGRVVGIRMFAIYGLPVGLLVAGPLIKTFGFTAMATAYCACGLLLTVLIALHWRGQLWLKTAPTNAR